MKARRRTILDIRLRKLIESMRISELSEVKSERGALNPFVSGLLLSSSLMDEIRLEIPYNVHVAWGQALDEKDVLSGELDTIIYLGKPLYQWESIGYAIVPKRQVLSIIEVKRNFDSYDKHRKGCLDLKKFATKLYLIIYGTHTTMANVRKREAKLKEKGYTDVFHLVRWTIRKGREVPEPEPLYEDWYRLMDTVAERL